MKHLWALFFLITSAFADTPPARSINSFTYDGAGVNPLTIKPASTPAASADTSAVVSLNPNTPLPAGTNTLGTVNQALDLLFSGSVTVQDTSSTTVAGYNGQVWIIGTPTTGSTGSAPIPSLEGGVLEVSGTWTGTLQTEVSIDGGVTWLSHAIHQIGSPAFISSFNANIIGSINMAGKTNFRVRAISAFTGTAVLRFVGTINPASMYVANALKIVDGSSTTSSTTLSIKAASTQSGFTDTAVVVTNRPDNVGTPNQTSISCGPSSTALLAAGLATNFISIRNPTTSLVTIWVNIIGGTATTAPPSLDLPPGAEADFFSEGAGFLPTSAINCISSGTASSISLVYK